MNPSEVIVHEIKAHRVGMILRLLGKGIGQPGKPPLLHPKGQVGPLDIGGRNQLLWGYDWGGGGALVMIAAVVSQAALLWVAARARLERR